MKIVRLLFLQKYSHSTIPRIMKAPMESSINSNIFPA